MRLFVISIPRRFANERSKLLLTSISHNILPSNCAKSRVHSKSKEVRFDTSPEIHVIGMEFFWHNRI